MTIGDFETSAPKAKRERTSTRGCNDSRFGRVLLVARLNATVLVACSLATAACGPSKKQQQRQARDAFDAHRPVIKKKVDAVLSKAINLGAPLAADKIEDVPALRLWNDARTDIKDSNAAVLTVGWATTLAKRPAVDDHFGQGFTFHDFAGVAEWATSGNTTGLRNAYDVVTTTEAADALLAHIDQLQYVIVVRELGYTKFQIHGSSFEPGVIHAEAHVLDMMGGDHGGFRFEATNSDKVAVPAGALDFSEVERDLDEAASRAFEAGLVRVLPGTKLE